MGQRVLLLLVFAEELLSSSRMLLVYHILYSFLLTPMELLQEEDQTQNLQKLLTKTLTFAQDVLSGTLILSVRFYAKLLPMAISDEMTLISLGKKSRTLLFKNIYNCL